MALTWQKNSNLPNPKFILFVLLAILLTIFIYVNMARAETPLQIAQSQIGNGEEVKNNCGKQVRMYLNGQEGLPWCAGFVSYCLKMGGKNVRYTLRARDFLTLGKIVKNPKKGDLVVFSRQGGGHIGIIEEVLNNKIITIEGNVGEYPAKVKRVVYTGKIKNLLGFVRI